MNRQVILKNNAPFISCISKINGVLVENAEYLEIVMPMYHLLEYSNNYSKTSASLWNYYRDELTDETNDNNGPNKNIINSKSLSIRQVLQEVLKMFLEEELMMMVILQIILIMIRIKEVQMKLKFMCH